MFGSDLYVSLVVGVVLSLVYVERTGVLPAGLVVPGYLGLIFDQPLFLAAVFLISFATFLIVTQVVERFVLLYGRRQFAAMLVTGIILKLLFDYFYPIMPFEVYEFRGIGVIVPGLIANAVRRQGVTPTLVATLVLSALTFLITYGYALFLT